MIHSNYYLKKYFTFPHLFTSMPKKRTCFIWHVGKEIFFFYRQQSGSFPPTLNNALRPVK